MLRVIWQLTTELRAGTCYTLTWYTQRRHMYNKLPKIFFGVIETSNVFTFGKGSEDFGPDIGCLFYPRFFFQNCAHDEQVSNNNLNNIWIEDTQNK